ncbi:MAG: hypothetical protein KGD61_05750 [Candidatus Lokiarchaeota archaeon]|nr:hypothetical protein [Candidatus Lokiarchaeota archaeon]
MTNVFENSQKLVVENAKEKSFSSPNNAEDLTVIKGIGPCIALKLNRAKIYTFKQLANVSPEIISEIPGINVTTAFKFITGAKNLLGEFPEENSYIEQSQIKELDKDSPKETSPVQDISEILEVENTRKISILREEREEVEVKIEESLKKLGYYLIPNTISSLNSFIENIDYIGCKLVRVSRWVNHIFIIPIKMYDLEGTVLVDEAKLDYNPKTNVGKTESMSRLRHYSKNLLYARDLMFEDIIVDGKFREFFQKYLQVSLTLEKSVENKKLFFKSGQTQYKVLIEPIMLCRTPPRCMEKSISLPYQRNTNLHVIHLPDLSQLLGFLEQKYRLIESRVKSSNSIKNYQKMDEKFRNHVRIASIPLVGYAVALLVVYFAEFFFLLRLFNSIGFAIIGIYLSVLAYLYFKFYRTKKELAKEFKTPYYKQNLEFSEIDMLEFKDQLTTEHMAQFGYECFGKDKSFKVLEEIERGGFTSSVDVKLIGSDSQSILKSKEETEERIVIENSKLNNKYLSFLED